MQVHITYPAHADMPAETLEATEIRPGIAELRQHSGFIPLGPGDRVQVDQSGDVLGVEHLDPVFTYEVVLHLPADLVAGRPLPDHHPSRAKIQALLDELSRDAVVTRTTNFSFLVSSQSRRWLDEKVVAHKYVDNYRLIRTPDLQVNLSVATAHPNLDGARTGPWS